MRATPPVLRTGSPGMDASRTAPSPMPSAMHLRPALLRRVVLPAAILAWAGALMIAAAPFEILIGTLRANDVMLAWLVGLAMAALVVLDERPVWQGLAVALLGWLAFYVKLWVLYFFPALGVYYLFEAWRRG